MSCKTLIVSCSLVFCLAVPGYGDVLEGTLLITYRNLLLITSPVSGEQVVLLPDAVSYKHFNSLKDLRKGSRLKIGPVRNLPGVTVADSLELVSGASISPDVGVSPSDVWEKIVRRERMMLLDIRAGEHFNRGHLPGACSFPTPSNLSKLKDILEDLKPAKETPVIIYSSDESDLQLNEISKQIQSLGFTNVRILATGMAGWLENGHFVAVQVDTLKNMVKAGKPVVLVDTREEILYESGHLPGAINISSNRLHPDMIMPYDAADPLVFYGSDADDIKPMDAAFKAASWGYLQKSDSPVMVLEGGVSAWKSAGMRIETGKAGKTSAGLPTSTRGIILYDEFKSLWEGRGKENTKLFLDVRSRLELLDAKIKNIVHIPVDELPFRLSELPKDKEIVVYCSSGRRSRIAYHILQQNGFRTRYLGRMLSVSSNGEID